MKTERYCKNCKKTKNIQCHSDCIQFDELLMTKRVKALKSKVNFDDSDYAYELCMYDNGEKTYQKKIKKL